MAIFLWIYGFMSPVAGIIADRVNRKWLVVGSLFVWSAVTFLMGYAHDFHELYWLRAIMGVSEALYIPSALSLIADWHEGKSRSLAVGVHMTGLYVGQAIGGFGATAAAAFSWQATFHWFGIVGIVYSLVLILFLKENPIHNVSSKKIDNVPGEKKPSIISGLSLLFTNWAFWIILFLFCCSQSSGWATKNWLPTLFADSLNIPMSEAGPISTITIAVSSFYRRYFRWYFVRPLGTKKYSWTGLYRSYRFGNDYTGFTLLGFGHSFVSVIGAGLLFGIGFGIFDANNMPILCQFVSAKHRATAYGIMNMTGVFAGAAVTEVLGKWTDGGSLGQGFAMLSIVVAVALVLQIYFLRPKTDNMVD